MENIKLKTGERVTIAIPFEYEIGDFGYYTHKKLETVQDCMDEVQAEIDNGVLNDSEVYMTHLK